MEELLIKIQEVNRHAVVYLWLNADKWSREPAIDDPEEILTLLSNMKNMCTRCQSSRNEDLYTHKYLLVLWNTQQDNGEHFGWWLQSTEQRI